MLVWCNKQGTCYILLYSQYRTLNHTPQGCDHFGGIKSECEGSSNNSGNALLFCQRDSYRASYSCYYHWALFVLVISERPWKFSLQQQTILTLITVSGPEITIILLFVGLSSSEVTHRQKLLVFLLLIFQKPLIQLCLFIEMLWAKSDQLQHRAGVSLCYVCYIVITNVLMMKWVNQWLY